MVLAARKEGASSFLARIAYRLALHISWRVSPARTHALRLVISLADYFAVNIAVTLFRIVATLFPRICCEFTRVASI